MHHWHGTHGTYGYRVQKNVAIWENHRSLNRSSHGFQQTIESIPMKDPSFIPGWWYTYPSEKMKVSQLGLLSFPTEWKDKKCSKPPTRSPFYSHVDRKMNSEQLVTGMQFMHMVPSGKTLHNYGKSPFYSWVNQLFLWPFSMSQTVCLPEGIY
jgi:hypothetical protein